MRTFIDFASKYAILIALTGMVTSPLAVAKDDHAKPVDFQRDADRDSGGGANVGTGGGLAEAHIAYSYLSLDKFIQLCKSNAACVTSTEEASYLDELAAGTRDERKSIMPKFKAEKDDPGFFMADGVEQAFRTERTVGSEVWFNLDKIYVTEAAGVVKALPMKELLVMTASALAVHVPGALPADVRAALFKRLADESNQNLMETHSNWVANAEKFGAVGYVERTADGRLFSVAVSDFTSAFDQTGTVLEGLQNIFNSAGHGPVVIKKSRILQASWSVPVFHFQTIDASFSLKSLIETDAQDGSHGIYRCQMSFKGVFNEQPSENFLHLYFLDTEASHWTVSCDQ